MSLKHKNERKPKREDSPWFKDWLKHIRKVKVLRVHATGTPVYTNRSGYKE